MLFIRKNWLSREFSKAAIAVCVCAPGLAAAQSVTATTDSNYCYGFTFNVYQFLITTSDGTAVPQEYLDRFNKDGQDQKKITNSICDEISVLEPLTTDENTNLTAIISNLNDQNQNQVVPTILNENLDSGVADMDRLTDTYWSAYQDLVKMENARGLGPISRFLMRGANSFYYMAAGAGASPELPAKDLQEIITQDGANAIEILQDHPTYSSIPALNNFMHTLRQNSK